MSVQFCASPVGFLEILADQRKLRAISFADEAGEDAPNEITQRAAAQLAEYFAGKRQEFNIAALPHGTPFQIAVWSALSRLPYGKVATYGQLAAAIGRPSAVRAVANAVGANPLVVLLPCHRIVAADGLGGFTGGLEKKRTLLRLEGVEISEKSAFSENFIFTFD